MTEPDAPTESAAILQIPGPLRLLLAILSFVIAILLTLIVRSVLFAVVVLILTIAGAFLLRGARLILALRNATVLFGLGVIGGALPWVACAGLERLLLRGGPQNPYELVPGRPAHDGLSSDIALVAPNLLMPLVAILIWVLARRLWPKLSRPSAIFLAIGIWIAPGTWMLWSTVAAKGYPVTTEGVRFSLGLPLVLSFYMWNWYGLAAAVVSLAVLAFWRPPKDRSSRATSS